MNTIIFLTVAVVFLCIVILLMLFRYAAQETAMKELLDSNAEQHGKLDNLLGKVRALTDLAEAASKVAARPTKSRTKMNIPKNVSGY